MRTDFGRYSVHINRHYLSNFALGFDYYQLHSQPEGIHEASILQLNFLLFNITFTRWQKWI
jgi:hypothetical protein